MNQIAVLAKDLTRVFGSFVAVDNVSFEVQEGEIFGFLGPNGAGKTTTIKILCGLLTPSSGKGIVVGYDVSTQSEEIKKHIGYMSQKFSLYEDLTVLENLEFFGGVYGLNPEKKSRRSSWVLEMAGLTDKTDTLTRSLALGWKQRLALGCAILHEPPVLFLDEPTSGVDPLSRRNFWDLINDLASQGVTIFVTTHYMEEAEYCNRLALMSTGKIVAIGTPSDLKKNWMPEFVIDLECDQIMQSAELLKEEPIFSEAAVFGNSLHLVTKDPGEAEKKAREILASNNIGISRLEIVTPSLEDVFVTLTSPTKK
ncbi:MAG: ABC transporter ATP-binding protein [Deltaproteobacteria bacterium]|nr:ABC transporter ATP-binding protein [Deltaproteobacteria bacterium]